MKWAGDGEICLEAISLLKKFQNTKNGKESIWIKIWLFLCICLSICLFLLSIGWVSWLELLFSRSWAWCRGSAPSSRLASFLQHSPRPWPPLSALPKCSRWCRACVSPHCCCRWTWINLKDSFSPAIIFHHLLKHFNVCTWLKCYQIISRMMNLGVNLYLILCITPSFAQSSCLNHPGKTTAHRYKWWVSPLLSIRLYARTTSTKPCSSSRKDMGRTTSRWEDTSSLLW